MEFSPPHRNVAISSLTPQSLGRAGVLWVFGAWTLIAILVSASVLLDGLWTSGQPRIPVARVLLAFAEAYLWASLTLAIFWLVRRYPNGRRHRGARVLVFIGAGLVIVFVLAAVMQWLRRIFNTADMNRPFAPVSAVGVAIEALTYTAVLIAGFERQRRIQATALQEQTTTLRAQLTNARLSALRSQLNPHFLFNTLHAIAALASTDPPGVRRMISQLSDLLRISLNEASTPETPLRRELDFMRQYLALMRRQMRPDIDIVERIEAETLDCLVPTLLLQPLIENALKHGLSRQASHGRLVFSAQRVQHQLWLRLSNTVPSGDPAILPIEHLGLRNTRERLEEIYGADGYTFKLTPRADNDEFLVEISLPVRALNPSAIVKMGQNPSREHLR